jgi:TonB-dependent SusC/RagA subfamily outer membrane receptor
MRQQQQQRRDGTAPGSGRTAGRARRRTGAEPQTRAPVASGLAAAARRLTLGLATGALAGCAGRTHPAGTPGQLASAVTATAATGDSTRPTRRRSGIDDSVGVGYGTQRRRDLTGAVGSVVFEDAADQQGPRIEQLLARVPGVQVSARGDGSFSVRVRGSHLDQGEPLWVLDGMPVSGATSVLSSVAPRDVERIDVLKDAAAAIYGSQARHGVILVRTRRGGS